MEAFYSKEMEMVTKESQKSSFHKLQVMLVMLSQMEWSSGNLYITGYFFNSFKRKDQLGQYNAKKRDQLLLQALVQSYNDLSCIMI